MYIKKMEKDKMNLKDRTKEMQNFFANKIETYDDVHSVHMNTKKSITEHLDKDIKEVIDLGAGTGLELIYLFERFPNVHVTAIDATQEMLDELSKRPFASNVTTICGDFFEVSFGENVDAVISTASLHHFDVEDKKRLYKKIYDCLKEGGQFLNADKLADSLEDQERDLKEYLEDPHKWPHMDTPLCEEVEREILENVGFKDIESINVESPHYKLLKARK